MRRATVAVFVILAACSGSSDYTSADELRDDSGLSCDLQESGEIFVKDGGPCEGQSGGIYIFGDTEGRDQYLKIATTFGGGPYLVGPNWIIEGDTDDLEKAQENVGGEIRE